MEWFRPGDTMLGEFSTANATTGAPADADAPPTVAVVRNGAVDPAPTVIVTNLATGYYSYSVVIPETYTAGDQVSVRLTATVGGVSGTLSHRSVRLTGLDLSQPAIQAVLTAAAAAAVADVMLRRNQGNVEAAATGDALDLNSLYGMIQQVQRFILNGDQLIVFRTDGATVLGTKTVQAAQGAKPVTGMY